MKGLKARLKQPAVRFVGVFIAAVLGFNLLLSWSWVDENVVYPYARFITSVSAATLHGLGYADLSSQDTFLQSGRFAVDIRRGCDGVVASMLLVAACLAYPAPWRQRLLGMSAGFFLIFALNQARIVVLFALGDRGAMDLFNFVHTYVAQFAVIAVTMVFWVAWAGRQRPLYE